MGALGILGTSSLNCPTMLEETDMDKAVQQKLTMKLISPVLLLHFLQMEKRMDQPRFD